MNNGIVENKANLLANNQAVVEGMIEGEVAFAYESRGRKYYTFSIPYLLKHRFVSVPVSDTMISAQQRRDFLPKRIPVRKEYYEKRQQKISSHTGHSGDTGSVLLFCSARHQHPRCFHLEVHHRDTGDPSYLICFFQSPSLRRQKKCDGDENAF